jgi:hydrogenase expression/formation protein HypD
MSKSAQQWLALIKGLPAPADGSAIRIMNVCGGHERSITTAGLRSLLPGHVELVPGPGCPVCVCPEEDIYEAIQLALHESVILIAFGDMLRVPVNVPKGEIRSLEQARAAGADIRPIASPTEAVEIARNNPDSKVVFFVAGFETTTAPVAAMVAEGVPANLLLLMSGRLTWPAVAMLLESGTPGFQALVAPGHVSTVMGSDEWQFVVKQHHIPAAVAGFIPESLLAAFYSVLRQIDQNRLFLDNCYPELVTAEGNLQGQRWLNQVMDIYDANWRGIGTIPKSGYELKPEYDAINARIQLPNYRDEARKRAGQMPPGCDCAKVVLGKLYPNECKLYGAACTPSSPVGPCMVSDEGACRIWWSGGIHPRTAPKSPA